MTLRELERVTRQTGSCPVVRLEPEARQRLNVMSDDVANRSICEMKQLKLNFDECIEEKFFVAYGILADGSCSKAFAIPIYIPIKVVTLNSNTPVSATSGLWKKLLFLRNADTTFLSDANSHIMLYKTKPASLSEYDTLVPSCEVYEELQPRNRNSGTDQYQKIIRGQTLTEITTNSDETYSEASAEESTSLAANVAAALPPKLPPRPTKSGTMPVLKKPPLVTPSNPPPPEASTSSFANADILGQTRASPVGAAAGWTISDTRDDSLADSRKTNTYVRVLRHMTIGDVQELCDLVKLSAESKRRLKAEQVDGSLLYDLCEENLLQTELGLTKLETVKLTKAFLHGWQPRN